MLKRSILAVVLILVFFSSAFSINVDGNKLSRACFDGYGDFGEGFCTGYIMGTADSLVKGDNICIPKEATTQDIKDTVNKFIQEHPEQLPLPGSYFVKAALAASYPCK